VYTTLRRLEARGLVAGQWEDAEVAEAERRPRRRYYTLTAAGAEQLAVARDRLAGVVSGRAEAPVGEAHGA
jgi:DNA-binding PadR family transcriptional regulator